MKVLATYQRPVLLRGDPDVPVTPTAEIPQLLHLGMKMLDVVFHRETCRIKHSDITSQAPKDTASL